MAIDSVNDVVEIGLLTWDIEALVAVFAIGRRMAKIVTALPERMTRRTNGEDILQHILSAIVCTVLLSAVVIAALDQLGVGPASLLAILGAAGLAVGLGIKDSLSNFASGAMSITFRPFRAAVRCRGGPGPRCGRFGRARFRYNSAFRSTTNPP